MRQRKKIQELLRQSALRTLIYPYKTAIAFFIFLGLVGSLAHADGHNRLPALGDPSAATFSKEEERRVGRLILLKARSALPLVKDLELKEYINSLGERILAASGSHRLDFHFLLSRDPSINASAWPGGLIVINAGLLLFASHESELAAVVAHEIAHVKQRHIARHWSLAKQVAWADVVSIVAALAGAAYGSDAALLGGYASGAVGTQKKLGYSRVFETEADYLGMQIMAAANFHPQGMVSFFSRLKERETQTGQTPEFLRTHPLTGRRLADAISRAKTYQGKMRTDSLNFQQAKARTFARLDPAQALHRAEAGGQGLYQRAVALLRMNRAADAVALLSPLKKRKESKALNLVYAQALLASNNPNQAVEVLRLLESLYSGSQSIRYYLALALKRSGQGKLALAELRSLMNKGRYESEVDLLASEIAAEMGRTAISHEYLSDYYAGNGRLESALHQLDIAERQAKSKDHILNVRIAAKRKNIKQLIKEMREL